MSQDHRSPAEYWFKKRFEKATGLKLIAGDDWLCPATGTQYEVKDFQLALEYFREGWTSVNKDSIDRHVRAYGSSCVLVLVFNQARVLTAPMVDVQKNGVPFNQPFRDKTAYRISLAHFKELAL